MSLLAPRPTLLKTILSWHRTTKRLFVAVLDGCMGLLAMWLAFSLRLDVLHWPEGLQWMAYLLAPLLAFPILMNFGLYRAIFRYTGIMALITTGKAVATYGAILLTILLTAQWDGVPRSVGILQPLILLLMVGSSRALGWLWLRGRPGPTPSKLLIYGAGSAGAQTAAGLSSARHYLMQGFIDDDAAKVGRSINGARVYAPKDLPSIISRLGITDVLLAIPSASAQRRRQIIENLREQSVRVRTLPGLTDLASGKVTTNDIQDLDIEDLLGREPVTGTPEELSKNLRGKVVMVTGAGGSIGSELSRQIAMARPACLLLVDHSEFALYSIHQELQLLVRGGIINCTLVPLLASISNPIRINEICNAYSPTSIYHAAAYKHVPMVESNIAEGIRNNIFGTFNMVRAAIEHRVEHFVLISTDKAVRPTNAMGASKRAAELILQAVASTDSHPFQPEPTGALNVWRCPTKLSMVRFGNVLGSSGSVIPLFRRQIISGGPITVTHPDVTRYFMTIPEAAQLVLQAGTTTEGGEVFVLDMGEPVKIFDLARRMIALSGLTVRDEQHPRGDIAIELIGLRSGEKLYEELLINGDPLPTANPRIQRAREEYFAWLELKPMLQSLQEAERKNDEAEMKRLLAKIVTGYQPKMPTPLC